LFHSANIGMEHSNELLLNLAVCLTVALVCGCVAERLRFSPIVGYLVAGIICGPYTVGFVANPELAAQLANIGVVLLMFGVGLHFNFHELLAVRKIAVPGAVIQSLVATAGVTAVSHLMGLDWWQGLVVGLAVSVASTAVLARMLTDHHQLSTPVGHLAMGWLVVEDVFTVIVLVFLPMLAVQHGGSVAGSSLVRELGLALGKLLILVALVVVLGLRFVPWLLNKLTDRSEMFNLAVPVVALGIASISEELFGVSLALGAFLAGVVTGQSRLVERVEATVGPIRDPFTVLFFLSIGTLVDPYYVITHPIQLLFVLMVILIIKPLTALVLVRLMHQPLHTAMVVAVGLAQVGEFSFILIRQASGLNLLPEDQGHLLVSAAIISISLNPFLFANLNHIERIIGKLQWFRMAG
jgi:monovalent cation:H+ antiporter-2, CPA2 family